MSNTELNTVTVDVPLFIRLLELARETLKSDEELHDVVEAVLKQTLTKDVLTMKDYPAIWKDKAAPVALSRLSTLSRFEARAADNSEEVHDLALEIFGPKISFSPKDGTGLFSGEKALWVIPRRSPPLGMSKKFCTQVSALPYIKEAFLDPDGQPKGIKVVFN